MDALRTWKLDNDTLVVFTSDNGGTQQYTAPLNGGKGQLYEGGIRVPLAIRGPGVKQPGSKCATPVASIDFYPTFLEFAGLAPPARQTLDGTSLLPLLGGASTLNRTRMFWHFPCYVGRSPPSSALREGDFKLIEFFEDGGRTELYNLKTDPGERTNLALTMRAKAAAMQTTLRAWQKDTNALNPSGPNPAFDPSFQRDRNAPKGGKKGGPMAGKKGG
jgi:arylsulfatase A-like enzyme